MSKTIDRRGALKKVTLMMGGVAATPALLSVLQSCQQAREKLDWVPEFFDENQARLIMEISEHIIPKTDTPGAKEAGVHIFIDAFIKHCVPTKFQNIIPDGLVGLENKSQSQFQKGFLDISKEEQVSVLSDVAKADYSQAEDKANPTFFRSLKELTLMGYFNSQKGATEALALVQIPGDYEPCIPLEDGQKAWAL
ncbi:gluconate 2-dehydrogenase subunit 3 family protein [Fulvivirgaceae bacterium BMA12]|uniref:Gluconate 2-dehydrogenase subunit 3 family protein n=1 Tax=Agaribacillus aureus TaxID=3051825 RepID=A0ABT8LE15_9BACT|nr:gluconate 2-dehydrogenase subunit 3 family protein [Fulvivirgaceae bacterium BMA12]